MQGDQYNQCIIASRQLCIDLRMFRTSRQKYNGHVKLQLSVGKIFAQVIFFKTADNQFIVNLLIKLEISVGVWDYCENLILNKYFFDLSDFILCLEYKWCFLLYCRPKANERPDMRNFVDAWYILTFVKRNAIRSTRAMK